MSDPIFVSWRGCWLEPFCLYSTTLRPFSHFSAAVALVWTLPKNPPCCASIVTLVVAPPATAIPANASIPHTETAATAAISFLTFNVPRFSGLPDHTIRPPAGAKTPRERNGAAPRLTAEPRRNRLLELDRLAEACGATCGALGLRVELALFEAGVPDVPDTVIPALLRGIGADLLVD